MLSACATPVESVQTQENFKTEFLKMLKKDDVLVNPDIDYKIDYKKVSLGDGVEIFEEDLKMDLHVYDLDWEVIDVPTAEEIESLYNKYDDEIFEKFNEFYEWYRMNGGEVACFDYENALLEASINYRKEYGYEFNQINSWNDWTVNDFIDLESYVKENPDYSETSGAYKRLLKWLRVEKK